LTLSNLSGILAYKEKGRGYAPSDRKDAAFAAIKKRGRIYRRQVANRRMPALYIPIGLRPKGSSRQLASSTNGTN